MKPDLIFILENAAWPALLVDGSGTVLRASPAAVRAFGSVLEGEASKLSAIWSPDNGSTPEQFLARWERTPEVAVTLKFLVKGGGVAEFPVSICSFSREGLKYFVFQTPPEVAPAAGAAKTPTSEHSLAQKQKLDCALQLARTVSLDFNNVLTSILGHASFLLGKAAPGHPWRQSLLEVEKSAQRAAEISNELGAFSRHETEPRRAAPGNLNTVVTHCVDYFSHVQGGTPAWRLQLERGLFAAQFDEAKVQQAFMRILENAVEAVAGVNGAQITVRTRNVELTEPTQDRNVRLAAGAYVCVEITDNGHGIEPEVLERIFEPFFTTKRGGHRGLGLALVYGIITNHGGGVVVSGQRGAGASVRVYLPAERQTVRESLDMDEKAHNAGTVLVVDDEPLLLTMAEMILGDCGYTVLKADSGEKALALLSRDDAMVDLVVTDLVMPGMSGRELMERIRQLAPGTKLLWMSGYVMPADRQLGTTYLQKPFTSAELLSKVKEAFALHTSC
jgi:two-component system cell cycle sensor histidine kinase/response regulator CckA